MQPGPLYRTEAECAGLVTLPTSPTVEDGSAFRAPGERLAVGGLPALCASFPVMY